MVKRKAVLSAALCCLVAIVCGPGAAQAAARKDADQTFPTKPIRIVVPFPAGGTTDVVARIVALRMTESTGQPVIVDNRGGAGGSLGADLVAKANPDGYTMLMANITFPLS